MITFEKNMLTPPRLWLTYSLNSIDFPIDFPIQNLPGAQWREEGGDLRTVRERFPVRASQLRWLRLGLAGPMALERLGRGKSMGKTIGKP